MNQADDVHLPEDSTVNSPPITPSSSTMLDTQKKLAAVEVGDRIECMGQIGTIMYIGTVNGYNGEWLGIDWDDPKRGKHNGTLNSIKYFTGRSETSGSFVRPEKINRGQNIITAITTRYGSRDTDSMMKLNQQKLLCIQQCMNAPLLEMVGFDKIIDLQSNYVDLRIIDVRMQCVNSMGEPFQLEKLCPNIRELDISRNLIKSWGSIFDVCTELPYLTWLNVSQNILTIPANYKQYKFDKLRTLICGSMGLIWSDLIQLFEVFPNLEEIVAPNNKITSLDVTDDILQQVQIINIPGNEIGKWSEICKLGNLPELNTLYLDNIGLESIRFDEATGKTALFRNLRELYIKNNLINDWQSVGELNKLENLENLRFIKNPVFDSDKLPTCIQIVIARIANLKIYNGADVTEERKGAEYDYLKKYGLEWLQAKNDEVKKAEFLKVHNRYLELIEKHGECEEAELKLQVKTIDVSLIEIKLVHEDRTIIKKLPPSMLIQKLIMLVQRLFRLDVRPQLVYVSQEDAGVEIDLDDECKEMGIYSMHNGDRIMVKT